MKPITYSLQFRGSVTESEPGVLHKQASAPGSALETLIDANGLRSRFVWIADDTEARLDSLLRLVNDQAFTGAATIEFGHGHALRLRGCGELIQTASTELRHGVAVWVVEGGEGQFADASGRITSNFLVSQTGDLTDSQLGVVFAHAAGFTRQRAPR